MADQYEGKLTINVIEAKDIAIGDSCSSDPYVVLDFEEGDETKRTKTIEETILPVWNEQFEFMVKDGTTARVNLTMNDWDKLGGDDFLGQVSIPVAAVLHVPGGELDLWLELLDEYVALKKDSENEWGRIHLKVKYFSTKTNQPFVPLPKKVDKVALLKQQRALFEKDTEALANAHQSELNAHKAELEAQKAEMEALAERIRKEQAQAAKVRQSLVSAKQEADANRKAAMEAMESAKAAGANFEDAQKQLEESSWALEKLEKDLEEQAQRAKEAERQQEILISQKKAEAAEKAHMQKEANDAKRTIARLQQEKLEQVKRKVKAEQEARELRQKYNALLKEKEKFSQMVEKGGLNANLFLACYQFPLECQLTTSISEANSRKKYDRHSFWTNKVPNAGDHVTLRYPQPLEPKSGKFYAVRIESGKAQRSPDIAFGRIEVSQNGNDKWRSLGNVTGKSHTFFLPSYSIVGVRLVFDKCPGWALIRDFGVFIPKPAPATLFATTSCSVPGRNKSAIANLKPGTYFRSTRPPKRGDTILLTSKTLVGNDFGGFAFTSGGPDGSLQIENAEIHTSSNGKLFRRKGVFHNGVATCTNTGRFKYVRIAFVKSMTHNIQVNDFVPFSS